MKKHPAFTWIYDIIPGIAEGVAHCKPAALTCERASKLIDGQASQSVSTTQQCLIGIVLHICVGVLAHLEQARLHLLLHNSGVQQRN
mmetsp:Transcript_75974/g.126650  ORF Transcript_75974/g.126650 Transcript_75974/m.126650 type:complete len:87 (-) Transcript_75974:1343-1603(-)